MTELLYLNDCYLKEFDATVVESGEGYVVLDQTCFYVEGGGQETDHGYLEFNGNRIPVKEVRKKDGKIIHNIEGNIPEGSNVRGVVDWERRFKEMRMHTSQHLLSAIILDTYGAETAGNQIHTDRTRVDFSMSELTEEMMEPVVERFNQLVDEGINIDIYTLTREEVTKKIDEKRLTLFSRIPDFVKDIRIIDINSIDQCPCGGTHLSNTREIGYIKNVEIIRKGADRQRVVYSLK